MQYSYYEIREKDGFKNVSLANVLAANPPNEPVTFVRRASFPYTSPFHACCSFRHTAYLAELHELYRKYVATAFEVQVANHELLGHGTGKLFSEDADGKLNFEPAKVTSPRIARPFRVLIFVLVVRLIEDDQPADGQAGGDVVQARPDGRLGARLVLQLARGVPRGDRCHVLCVHYRCLLSLLSLLTITHSRAVAGSKEIMDIFGVRSL